MEAIVEMACGLLKRLLGAGYCPLRKLRSTDTVRPRAGNAVQPPLCVFYASGFWSTSTEYRNYGNIQPRSADLYTVTPTKSRPLKLIFYHLLSIAALIAFFLPILLVGLKRLWPEKPFLIFGVYWLISGMVNLVETFMVLPAGANETLKVALNTADIPLALAFIHYSTASFRLKRFTAYAAPLFFCAELVNFYWRGWHYDSGKYIMGVGILLVLIGVIWEISIYMHKLEHDANEHSMVFFHISLFFAYGTLVIIYVFYYYFEIRDAKIDNYLIYYFSSLVAILIASYGFLTRKRRPQYL